MFLRSLWSLCPYKYQLGLLVYDLVIGNRLLPVGKALGWIIESLATTKNRKKHNHVILLVPQFEAPNPSSLIV